MHTIDVDIDQSAARQTEETQALEPDEAWARSLTSHELAMYLERAFARRGRRLTAARRSAVVAEAARRLRRSVGEAHRDSQHVPEKFNQG